MEQLSLIKPLFFVYTRKSNDNIVIVNKNWISDTMKERAEIERGAHPAADATRDCFKLIISSIVGQFLINK